LAYTQVIVPLNTSYISWAKQTTQPAASAREQMKRRNTYYVYTCDAISLKRLPYLGKANLTPEEVVSVAPRQVLNFYGSLELPYLTKGHITKDLKAQVIKRTSP